MDRECQDQGARQFDARRSILTLLGLIYEKFVCLKTDLRVMGAKMNADTHSVSLYDRIGGRPKIEAIIDGFYQRVLRDPSLAPFFEHSNLDNLRKMQVEFFAAALGGPQEYSGRTVAAVHHGRGIQRKHFSAFCQHLFKMLEEMGVPHEDINATVARISLSVRDVTGEPTVDG